MKNEKNQTNGIRNTRKVWKRKTLDDEEKNYENKNPVIFRYTDTEEPKNQNRSNRECGGFYY